MSVQALAIVDVPQSVIDINGLTPRESLAKLGQVVPSGDIERRLWIKNAKVAAIIGSCPKTRQSFRSGDAFVSCSPCSCHDSCMTGISNWIKFVEHLAGDRDLAFPPCLDHVIVWSHTFRCVGTFANYLGYLRSACLALDIAAPPADSLAIRRAKGAIVKRMLWTPRPRMFIQREMMRNMVLAVDRQLESHKFAMLWLVAYWFLLRVPSEALPMQKGIAGGSLANSDVSVLSLEADGRLRLQLASRKNKQGGSSLWRSCSCAACVKTCPVHVLWHEFFDKFDVGARPWADVSASVAREQLRATLRALRVPDAASYGTHDFRRGHAKDLQQAGTPMAEILRAGEWRSRAFVKYLDLPELEQDTALEAAMESDNAEWIE